MKKKNNGCEVYRQQPRTKGPYLNHHHTTNKYLKRTRKMKQTYTIVCNNRHHRKNHNYFPLKSFTKIQRQKQLYMNHTQLNNIPPCLVTFGQDKMFPFSTTHSLETNILTTQQNHLVRRIVIGSSGKTVSAFQRSKIHVEN